MGSSATLSTDSSAPLLGAAIRPGEGGFKGRPLHGTGISDIAWLRIDGEPMSDEDWQQGFAKSLMVFLNGSPM